MNGKTPFPELFREEGGPRLVGQDLLVSDSPMNGHATVTDKGEEIDGVELRNGPLGKVHDLMFRGEGWLLLFSVSDRHAVWMPFMRFDLQGTSMSTQTLYT